MKLHPLKVARESQRWSQAKIAQALGVSIRTVSRWEQGLVVPFPYYRRQLCTLFDRTAEELGLPSEIDEEEDEEDMEEALILMTQPHEPDVQEEEADEQEVGEKEGEQEKEGEEAPALEPEGSMYWRNGYNTPSLMKSIGIYSLPILEKLHGRRRLLGLMLFLLVIVVVISLAFLSSELFILTVRKTPEVTKTPTPNVVTDGTETKVEPKVDNKCDGPNWQSHTEKSYGRYYTVKTNGSPFCYHASWAMPSGITAAKSCDFHVFSYPGSTATVRYYFSTYHRNAVYADINQTTSNWSYFPRFMDVSFIELYINDNQSDTTISVGPFLINNCQIY